MTFGAAKLATTFGKWAKDTYDAAAATLAARTATIANMEAIVAETSAKVAELGATQAMVAVAREEAVAKLASSNASIAAASAAITAAEAAGAQSFALRTVRLATAELTVAEAQRSAMLAELATLGRQQASVSTQIAAAQAAQTAAQTALNGATGAGTVAAGLASRTLGLLGGPIGAIVTVLGLAATAWSIWGRSAETSSKQAAESYEESHKRIIKGLDEQIAKNQKLVQLQNLGMKKPEIDRNQPVLDQLATASKRLNDINNQTGEYAPGAGKSNTDAMFDRMKVMKDIVELTEKMKKGDDAALQASAGDTEALIAIRERLTGVNAQYMKDLEVLQAKLKGGAIGQDEYVAAVTRLAKETYEGSTAGKLYAQSLDAQASAIQRAAEAQGLRNQRNQEHIQFLKSSGQADEETTIRAAAAAQVKDLNDQIVAQRKLLGVEAQRQQTAEQFAQKKADINGKIGALNIQVDNAQKKSEEDLFLLEQQRYRQAVNNTADLIEAARAEAKSQQDQTRDQEDYVAQLGMTSQQIAAVTASRLRDQAAQMDMRAEISMVEEVTEAYRKQAVELRKRADLTVSAEQIKAQQNFWGEVDRVAHDTFVSIEDGGKSLWTRLRESGKNIFFEWLYQMTLRKWVINIGASVDGAPAVAGLANGGSALLQNAGPLSSLYGAVTGGMTAAGGLGTGFVGSLAGGLNGAGAGAPLASSLGLSIGNSIADVVGTQIAGALSTGLGAIATALPWVGGALAVVSLAKAAFGHGDREYTGSTLNGSLGAGGFTGGVDNAWKEKGGWFSSDRTGVQHVDANAAMATGLSTTYQALKDATSAYAKVLGLNAESIANRTQAISIALGKDEAANQKAIADFFAGVGEQIAKELVPDLDKFTKAGESASATLQRLAADLQGTDQVAQLLGLSGAQLFGGAGMESMGAREQLIDAAGGIQALAQQAQVFNQNFLTDAERLAPVAAALDKGLASLGLATIPTTRDEFKALVQDMIASGAAATAAGASQLAAILSYGDAFAQVHPQIDAAAEAAERAAAALQAMKDQASRMFAGVDDAYSVLQKVVSREKSVIQASVDTHTAAFNKLQSLSQALHSTLDSMKSPDQKAFERAAAQAQIRAALAIAKAGGPLPDSDSLKSALSAVTQDASSQFSSYADYMRDLLQTQNDVAALAGLADDSLSVEQRSLDALKDQLARLDDIVANGQAQFDALNGQSIATLSLAQAMAALQSSISAAQANPVVSGTSTIAGFYQELLGRAPDQAGLQYWQDVLASGASLENIRNVIMGSDEYKKLHPFAIGTNFVPETMPALVHQGERIIPAADNRVLMSVLARASGGGGDSAALVAEIKALRAEVVELRKVSAQTAKNTGDHKDMYENATAGGKAPMLVEIAQ